MSKFFKSTSIYLLSNVFNAIIPFILLPILTRYLTVEEYGQIAMFQTLLIGVTAFVGINAVGAANRKYYDDKNDKSGLKQFNGSCIQILVFSVISIAFLIYYFEDILCDFLAIPITWIIASVVISAFGFITSMRLGQWQIRSDAKYFGILQVSRSVINMILSLLFVVFLLKGSDGRVDALVITAIIVGIISFCLLYKNELLQILVWRPNYLKEILNFGIPLVPHTVGIFLISSVDRFVINDKLGVDQAGIYMVAVQLSSSMAIFFDAINKSYVPWLFERLKSNVLHEKKLIVKYTYIYFVIVLLVAVLAFIIGPYFITLIAGEQYSEAGYIIGLLCLGQAFGGMYLMVTNYIFYVKKTGKLAMVTIITGGINLILLYFFISIYGLVGAALSFAISKFIQFFITWLLAMSVIRMPWFNYE